MSIAEVLGGLDIVFRYLVDGGTCITSRPSTPEGELRQEIAALRLMVRQGQGANEQLREARKNSHHYTHMHAPPIHTHDDSMTVVLILHHIITYHIIK